MHAEIRRSMWGFHSSRKSISNRMIRLLPYTSPKGTKCHFLQKSQRQPRGLSDLHSRQLSGNKIRTSLDFDTRFSFIPRFTLRLRQSLSGSSLRLFNSGNDSRVGHVSSLIHEQTTLEVLAGRC